MSYGRRHDTQVITRFEAIFWPPVQSWLVGLVVCIALVSGQTQAAHDIGAVMPVGDSITAGYSHDPTVDAGWRAPLYKSLTARGYSIQFVGVTNVKAGLVALVGQKRAAGCNVG